MLGEEFFGRVRAMAVMRPRWLCVSGHRGSGGDGRRWQPVDVQSVASGWEAVIGVQMQMHMAEMATGMASHHICLIRS